jgi:DNA-binding NarL/FixJ family response regulator
MDVIVVVLCGSVHVGIARTAIRNGWSVLALGSAIQAVREIRDRAPRLVIVQVTQLSSEPIRLVRLLRHSAQPVLIVAVANTHRNQLERLARDAGASCYLPSAEDEIALEQAVTSMLEFAPSCSLSGAAAMQFDPSPPLARQGRKGVHR